MDINGGKLEVNGGKLAFMEASTNFHGSKLEIHLLPWKLMEAYFHGNLVEAFPSTFISTSEFV